jgi:hypothetical protein
MTTLVRYGIVSSFELLLNDLHSHVACNPGNEVNSGAAFDGLSDS